MDSIKSSNYLEESKQKVKEIMKGGRVISLSARATLLQTGPSSQDAQSLCCSEGMSGVQQGKIPAVYPSEFCSGCNGS